MNCWILLALLCCCQNDGCLFGSNGGCRRNSGGMCRPESSCGSQDNDRCDCRDGRPEPRLEPRPFISYQGSSSCGCEAQENNGCN